MLWLNELLLLFDVHSYMLLLSVDKQLQALLKSFESKPVCFISYEIGK